MGRRVVWLALFLTACAGTKPGMPCQDDATCGSGFDCYEGACVRVCADASECGKAESCERHRCIPNKQADKRTRPQAIDPGVGAAAPPRSGPAPDSFTLELRAIRKELELLRQEQAKLRELIEGQQASKPR